MSKRKRLIFPLFSSLILLLASILTCNFHFPWENPITEGDRSKLSTAVARMSLTVTAESAVGTAQAANTAYASTIHPTDVMQALFIDSDCPGEAFPGLTTSWGAGSLDCTYHWTGHFGVNNLEMRIMQYPDHSQYQQVISSDLANYRTIVTNDKATQAAPGVQTKKDLNVIEDDTNGFIYMETYNRPPSATDSETALCGYGWGVLGVDDKFEVSLSLTDACDISTSADVYSLATLRDAALAAIKRAEANKAP